MPLFSPPVWVTELAERFWQSAGLAPHFPRDLRTAATLAHPLTIVPRQKLTRSRVAEVLHRHGIRLPVAGPGRALRAALYCKGEVGFIFVDSTDPPAEQRFSVAHEIAHFLHDVNHQRQLTHRRLGPQALEVLDGHRPATSHERIAAVLHGVPLSPLLHLMNRDPDGQPDGERERSAEEAADQLAFELLAPAETLPDDATAPELLALLLSRYGLPPTKAQVYTELLLPESPPVGQLVEQILKFLATPVEVGQSQQNNPGRRF